MLPNIVSLRHEELLLARRGFQLGQQLVDLLFQADDIQGAMLCP